MRSSYAENNYSYLFDAIVRIYKPKLIVECGVLDGYSLFAMASAAKTYEPHGSVIGIDLFDDYEFKHGNQEQIEKDLVSYGLLNAHTRKADAIKESKNFTNESIDLLHIDISNTYERLQGMLTNWTRKLKVGGILMFEGGSEERDKVEWMSQYGHKSIRKLFGPSFTKTYEFVVLTPDPSITICRKKR